MTFFRRTTVSVVTFAGIDAPQRGQEGLVGPEFFALLDTAASRAAGSSLRDEFERREPVVVLSEGTMAASNSPALADGSRPDAAD